MQQTHHGSDLRKGRRSMLGQVYLVTTVTLQRRAYFSGLTEARTLINTLKRAHERGPCSSLAFVVMPDHLHWLVVLTSPSLPQLIKSVKSESARRMNLLHGVEGRPVWQRGFHDHALRRDEDLRAAARYLIANPLRAGLARRIGDYPHWDAIWL
jgi:putative transposase